MESTLTEPAELLQILQRLEMQMHHQATRRDAQRINELLHKDFAEIGRSGKYYTRKQTMMSLATENDPSDIQASDFALAILAEGVALLTYKSWQCNAAGMIIRQTQRASIWLRSEDSDWQMRFHQGTPTSD